MVNNNVLPHVEKNNVIDECPPAEYDFAEVNVEVKSLVNQVIMTCGPGRILDIGSKRKGIVRGFLSQGIDAFGLDCSQPVVDSCNKIMPDKFFHGSVLALPFPDSNYNTIISSSALDHVSAEQIPQALEEIYRVTGKYFYLEIDTLSNQDACESKNIKDRGWWERQCFNAGFRKHTAYYVVNGYESLNGDEQKIQILLEKIAPDTLNKYSLEALAEERDLHMDMLRETGSRSDAHVWRYQFASKYIRPGDRVLDAACGLGYGSHLLSALSEGGVFRGVDGSEYAINYANANFSIPGVVEFTEGYLPQCLNTVPDNSFDVVISYETLEHVEDPEALLNEFWRVLTPGGRLICSVPHDWSDETGEDPNPYHFHVYDILKFKAQLNVKFDIEHFFGQTADRVKLLDKDCEWEARNRSIKEIDLTELGKGSESEWLLAVASKSPVMGCKVPYVERMFTSSDIESGGNALAFKRDYENPWLVKSLVSIGLRTENALLRAKWSKEVLAVASEKSADKGAAICSLAYLELSGISVMPRETLVQAIDSYIQICTNESNPNVFRWIVSLNYVRALFANDSGQRNIAYDFFEIVKTTQVINYHGTLLTKVAESAYQQGYLAAARGDFESARSIWTQAFSELKRLMKDYFSLNNDQLPPDFVAREISEVLKLMSRLCIASKNIGLMESRPTLFYAKCNSGVSQGKGITDAAQGRDWLEAQCNGMRVQLSKQVDDFSKVQEGKDWLEAKWYESQEQITSLEAKWYESQKRITSIESNFVVRCLLKLGIIKI